MMKTLPRLLVAILLAVTVLGLHAPAQAKPSVLVVDMATGRTLHAQGADTSRFPASLTKMMTLYLLFDAIDRGQVSYATKMRVSAHAAKQPPTKLGLRPGQRISVRDAIGALATKSANDVAVVVAERLAGSEAAFARKMTAKARVLGMRRTTFRNASGLPDRRQRTTARDMATLGRALVRDHPGDYRVFATRSYRWGRNYMANHNRLLGVYRGMDGIKTGYTNAAGYNLVASAVRDGRRVVGVVMGAGSSASRNALMVRVLDKGFAVAQKTVKPSKLKTTKVASRSKRRGKSVRWASAPSRPAISSATRTGKSARGARAARGGKSARSAKTSRAMKEVRGGSPRKSVASAVGSPKKRPSALTASRH